MEKRVPVDEGQNVASDGTVGYSFAVPTTGDWQEIIMPVESKEQEITCDDGTDDYDRSANEQEFHFCFNGDGTGRSWSTCLNLRLAIEPGQTLVFLKAPIGNFFNINSIA
jgi:hypothetical protein